MLPEHLLYQQRRMFGQNITNTLLRAKTPPPPTTSTAAASPLPHSHQHPECKEVFTVNDNINNMDCDVNAYSHFQHQIHNASNTLHNSDWEKMELSECEQQCKRVKRDPYAEKKQIHHTAHRHRRTLSVPPTIMFTPNERVYRRSMKLSEIDYHGDEERGEQRQLFTLHKDNYNNISNLESERAMQLLQRKELLPPLFPPIFADQVQHSIKINNTDDKDEQSENSSNSSITFSDLDDVSPITLFDQAAAKASSTVYNSHNTVNINNANVESSNNNCSWNYCNTWESVMYNETNTPAETTTNTTSEYALFTPEIVSLMMQNTHMLEERLHIDNYRDLLEN